MLESSGAQVPTFDLQGASTANSEGSCISSRGARGDTTVTWEVGCAKRLTGSYQLLVSIGFGQCVIRFFGAGDDHPIIPDDQHLQWWSRGRSRASSPEARPQSISAECVDGFRGFDRGGLTCETLPKVGHKAPSEIACKCFHHSVRRHEVEKEEGTNKPLKPLKHEWCRNLFSEAKYIGIRASRWCWGAAVILFHFFLWLWFSDVFCSVTCQALQAFVACRSDESILTAPFLFQPVTESQTPEPSLAEFRHRLTCCLTTDNLQNT